MAQTKRGRPPKKTEEEKPETPEKEFTVIERKQYVCMVPCWHMGRKWKKGMVGSFADDELPRSKIKGKLVVRHFEELVPGVELPTAETEQIVSVTGIGEG